MSTGKQLGLFGDTADGTLVGVRLNARAAARKQEQADREQASTLSRRGDPETSKVAAQELVASGKLRATQVRVLEAVVRHPGSTYAELAHYEDLDPPEPARRLPELARLGYVRTITGPDNKPFEQGIMQFTWRRWMNTLWTAHTGLPNAGSSASAKGFIWHKNAVGYATGAFAGNAAQNQAVQADITWHGDRAAHFINHMMSGGACLIDDSVVFELDLDDSSALPTAAS